MRKLIRQILTETTSSSLVDKYKNTINEYYNWEQLNHITDYDVYGYAPLNRVMFYDVVEKLDMKIHYQDSFRIFAANNEATMTYTEGDVTFSIPNGKLSLGEIIKKSVDFYKYEE